MIINLSATKILRLTQSRGVTLEALDGALWVTEAGVPGDSCLAQGEQYRVQGDGLVLAGADASRRRGGATLALRPAPGRDAGSLLRRLGFKRLPEWNI